MNRLLAITVLAGLLVAMVWKRPSGREVPHLGGAAMGTRWNLEWRGPAPPPETLAHEVAATLARWEKVLSQWRPDSDLSRHNRGEAPTPELARVLRLAETIESQSGGAFSHRLLARSYAEGFGPPGDGIDLSAIGKGFAVDRVGETLRSLGVRDFLFELGGEVLAGDGEWEVAIERPDPAGTFVARTLRLRGQALATSGNYRQFRPVSGGLASHLLDPRDGGRPVIRPASSVSVLANDCATADAWATALFVLGPGHPPPAGTRSFWQPE